MKVWCRARSVTLSGTGPELSCEERCAERGADRPRPRADGGLSACAEPGGEGVRDGLASSARSASSAIRHASGRVDARWPLGP